jgi:hypothetical protein
MIAATLVVVATSSKVRVAIIGGKVR